MTFISRRRFIRGAAAVAGMIPAAAVFPRSSFAASDQSTLTITGSSTIAPLIQELAHKYSELNPEIKIDVQAGGSSRGITDVRRKISDIGMVSRRLKDEEGDLGKTLIAYDGIAMIVHSDNNVMELSVDDIQKIYKSEITNWTHFGGVDGEITVASKSEGRSTLEIFLSETKLNIKDIKAQVIVGDNEQAIKIVAGNPRSIAYVSIGTAEYHIKAGTPIKMIGIGQIPPSTMTVADGSYKAIRELNLVTLEPVSPLAAAFEKFVVSESNHGVFAEYYFVPPGK